MNKNSPLNQCYICSIGADGVQQFMLLAVLAAKAYSADSDQDVEQFIETADPYMTDPEFSQVWELVRKDKAQRSTLFELIAKVVALNSA